MPPTSVPPLPSPPDGRDSARRKVAKPISAAAFSFSLSTPRRKSASNGFGTTAFSPFGGDTPVKKEKAKETSRYDGHPPRLGPGAAEGSASARWGETETPRPDPSSRSRISETPDILVPIKYETPQSKRIFKPLGHFSTPRLLPNNRGEDPFSPGGAGRSRESPRTLPRALVRLNEHMDDVKVTDLTLLNSSKKRKAEIREEDLANRIGLSSVVEGLTVPLLDAVVAADEAEGIGVSPSRGQGRYHKDSL